MFKKEDFIFGIRPVIEAINAGKNIDKVLWQKGLRGDNSRELGQLLHANGIPSQSVPLEKLNSICRANHQGIIALLSPIEFSSIENILPGLYEKGEMPFILVLDSITDVRNFGAIVRTAECAGVHAIVIPDKGSARIGADAVKTSAGALMKVPVCRSNNMFKTLELLKNSGLQLIACTEKTKHVIGTTDMNVPLAIVMGAEDEGISNDFLKLCDVRVKIPMQGSIGSLNVGVAAGIITYEVLRQRGLWK
jgi:23S rRNA (guanosine2251-2'-O)-methyltransferase